MWDFPDEQPVHLASREDLGGSGDSRTSTARRGLPRYAQGRLAGTGDGRGPGRDLPHGGQQGESNEQPVHEVALKAPFALGQFEVTVAEFRRFVESADYRTEADPGEGCWSWSSGQFGYRKDLSWRKPGFEQDAGTRSVRAEPERRAGLTPRLSGQSGYPIACPRRPSGIRRPRRDGNGLLVGR